MGSICHQFSHHAPCGACCLWPSADGNSMSNAWWNSSVRAYLPVTKTHPGISGGCTGGLEIGAPFLATASADFWGRWFLFKFSFWSDHIFDILISWSSIVICAVASPEWKRETRCWWNAATRQWNKFLQALSQRPWQRRWLFIFQDVSGCSKSFQSCLISSGYVLITHSLLLSHAYTQTLDLSFVYAI